jgi:DNA-binding beta-propeller fold protein YncE
MRILVLLALLFSIHAVRAQPAIPVTQLAEAADGLSQPHDAALSPDGRLLYVTDMRNSRMRVYSSLTLKPVSVFGEGELSYPHDCEFDAAGRLLVADTGNDRIAIYDVKGPRPVLAGELKGLSGPEGVAVAADGRVIVTNTRAGTLVVFRDGKLERTVGRHGTKAGEFANPHDVEAAADGTFHVVDSGNNRVQVLDADLKPLSSSDAALGLNGPKYLSFDADTIWLADEYNHRLLKLDRQYRLLGVLGAERGRAPNRFHKPEAVVARAPHLWVIDTYNDRIVLLRLD